MTETFTQPAVRQVVVVHSPSSEWPRQRRLRSHAARVVAASLAAFLLMNLSFGLLLDYGPTAYRDPEYGLRLTSLRQRIGENPDRPLAVVIGSSRTAMGVRPGCIEDNSGPLLFNLSAAGAGPVTQLMFLRRLQQEGIKPQSVLLEYWPPFYRGDGAYREDLRLNPTRLRPEDVPTVREFFADPGETLMQRQRSSWLPFYAHRKPLLDRYAPGWLPHTERADAMFASVDGWGWLPGRDETSAVEREKGWPHVFNYYWPVYRFYSIAESQILALNACLEHCRQQRITVSLVFLPESTRFRSLQTPASLELSEQHLAQIQATTTVPLINARDWINDDESLPDGFHLTQRAAIVFTRRLSELLRHSSNK